MSDKNIDKDIENVQNYIDSVTVYLPKYSTKIPEKCIDEDTWLSMKNAVSELETYKKMCEKLAEYGVNCAYGIPVKFKSKEELIELVKEEVIKNDNRNIKTSN